MSKKRAGSGSGFGGNLIERQAASGMSIARFCTQAGVSANAFFVWKRRLRSQNGQSNRGRPTSRSRTAARARSPRSNDRAAAANPLVPVRLIADPIPRRAASAEAIEVEWPNGLVLRVPTGCDADTLQDVLQALRPGRRCRGLVMLTFPTSLRVFAHRFATDMRKSFEGLCGIIEAQLGQTVESGHLFLFFNRRRDRVKILYFSGDGLTIVYRKLEAGTFETPRDPQAGTRRHRLIRRRSPLSCLRRAQPAIDR